LDRQQHEGPLGRPCWDGERRVLWWRGRVVKELRREAPGQEPVLAAFEARGWPERVDDPLEDEVGVDPKQRLRDTVKNLNRGLPRATIRFHTDGTGRRLVWEALG
jgi:hypothetical protein